MEVMKLMQTIMVANQKGGVGKTTTSAALATGLQKSGYKVLLVDSDPQANLTASLNINPDNVPGMAEILYESRKIKNTFITTFAGDLIPSSILLADADRKLTQPFAYSLLESSLKELDSEYDICIIDAPPSLGILSLNGLTAADYLIVPVNASAFSLQGLSSLFDIVSLVKEKGNHKITILGILITRYNPRTNLSKEVLGSLEKIAAQMGTKVFDTKIRQAVSIEMAQAKRINIYDYANSSKAAQDYEDFVNEVIKQIKK